MAHKVKRIEEVQTGTKEEDSIDDQGTEGGFVEKKVTPRSTACDAELARNTVTERLLPG